MKKVMGFWWLAAAVFSAVSLAATGASPNTVESDRTPQEFVPSWAKHAVWYQIFPERFRNGDPNNDPTVDDIVGADPVSPPKAWKVHPWGSDWYQLQDYERQNGEPDLPTHLLRRRYGGDLQGIIDKLDYLHDLGVNALYLNPIFTSPSLHKYDAESYHHVDPTFGPDPVGDRKMIATEDPLDPDTWVWTRADELALSLIDEAHKRDMRVIFDGVFNHMGINSFAFRDLKKNQAASPYKDWFDVISFDDEVKGTGFDYKGWFGFKSLPEFKEDDNGLVAGPRAYVFAATERWMNPKGKGAAYGVDGWRLDVAFCIAHNFWKDWRQHVKALNPEAFLTAEIVDTPENVQPYMQGDEFDGEMNYNFAFAAAEFLFNPGESAITASEFDQKLRALRNLYPPGVAYVVQNLFGSHDSNRIGSHIVNRGFMNFRDWSEYHQLSQVSQNPDYKVRKPNQKELELQKLFVILQMTYVGAPMVYYGDEVGMWGANDPGNRKPMVWDDIAYSDETYLPNGEKRAADNVAVNDDLLRFYKTLISVRRTHPALNIGHYKTLLADDEKGIFAFERRYKNERIWVVINASGRAQNVRLPSQANATDLISGATIANDEGVLSLSLAVSQGLVLKL
ncbi:glycoside hydrolase family 13 protein [Gilvimarinus japonicus]|uniref:Glycoside hydrolase family 13 protein n=1 Tax=Gilvimarinus japonicus TaxID=1796469 RepID=A0ABV7HMU3_9GAMM